MKIALNLKALEAQPRKFVSLLSEDDPGPTEFTGEARRQELFLLRQFIRECLIEPRCCLIYRRWVYKTKEHIMGSNAQNKDDWFSLNRLTPNS